MPDDVAVPPFVPALRTLLVERGPLPLTELAAALEVPAERLQHELYARGDVVATLEGWRSLWPLVEGVVLTHVVTQEELDAGVLLADGDLGLWSRLADEAALPGQHGPVEVVRRDVPLDGVEGLRGPAGWLQAMTAGDLLALRFSEGRLTVEVAGAAPDDTPGMPTLLQVLLEEVAGDSEDDPGVLLDDVVVETLLRDPQALRAPGLPLLAVAQLIGLEVRGGRVALPNAGRNGPGQHLDRDQRVRLAKVRSVLAALAAEVLKGDGAAAASALELLADDDELAGVVGDDLAASAELRAALPALAAAPGGRRERAVAACLQAVVADADGDVGTAQRLLDEALVANSALQPALELAAHYAAERGDAAGADRLYRQAGHAAELPWRQAARQVATSAVTGEGRNRPCPCGSGRKAKLCCGTASAFPLPRRAAWRYTRAVTFAMRPATGQTVRDVVRAVDPDVVLLGMQIALFEGGVLARYLAERSVLWPDDERELVRSWLGTPTSLYEVVSVQRGRGVTVRALPTGEPVAVRDRELAAEVEVLDLLAGRLLPDGSGGLQFLAGPCFLPRPRRPHVLAALADADGDPAAVAAAFAPTGPPDLRTQEGEPVVLCRAVYAVPDLDDAWRRLHALLPTPAGDDELLATAEVDGDTLVRGVVRRTPHGVEVETNAVERLARLQELLRDVAPQAELLEEHRTPYLEALAHADEAFDPSREAPPGLRAELATQAE